MLKINFYVCVAKFSNITLKCIQSIINQKSIHKIKIYIIDNSKRNDFNKFHIKKLIRTNNTSIKFLVEKRKGIPFARNKSLEIIRSTVSDFSCLIDDDCELSKNWLKNMLRCHSITKSDIITGPQVTKFDNIYEKVLERHCKHLSKIKWAATNNVFMRSKLLNKSNIKFDVDLKNLGGSDQVFFSKLNKMGYSIIWNEYSKVFENRNQKKTNFIWFLKRNIRYGSSSRILYSKIHGSTKANIFIFFKFLYEILKFLFYFILVPLSLKKNLLYSLQYIIRALATLGSFFNIKLNEYKT